MPQTPQHVLTYDVGGSHISAAVCEQGAYALHGISRAPLPESITAASFVRLIHTLGETAAGKANLPIDRIAGACLALPGPFDYENGISLIQHKLQALYKFDLKTALAARFHWQPQQLLFVNDAAAFTLGEAGAGAAKGHSRVLGITLGTGIGASFAVNRKIADRSPGNPEGVPEGGELWNQPYNGSTVEEFVSTRYLRHHYQTLSGLEAEVAQVAAIAQCEDSKPCPELEDLLAKQIQPHSFESTEGGATLRHRSTVNMTPAQARQAFHDFGLHLGLALNQHAAAFRPEIIVFGGGIARASSLFLPTTRQTLSFPTALAISTLMDEAPLAGAAVHWFTPQNSPS
jgi:glucokinase